MYRSQGLRELNYSIQCIKEQLVDLESRKRVMEYMVNSILRSRNSTKTIYVIVIDEGDASYVHSAYWTKEAAEHYAEHNINVAYDWSISKWKL